MSLIPSENAFQSRKKALGALELSAQQHRTDETFMRRCIQLARQGGAGTRPNPMVGAVVVHEGRIIGEGFHICQGGPHAEVNAIRSVREKHLLPESTIYVSLEPCSHYGSTPPCADMLVEHRLKRCVVGCRDPFAKVDGLGIQKLLDGGVEVVVGVLEEECLALNASFVRFHTSHRPYILLKWAQSRDGFMDGSRSGEARPVCFSTPLTLTLMHRVRSLGDAILVGGGTALSDNPSLTVRRWAPRGETGNLSAFWKAQMSNGRGNPLRVVIDAKGNLPRSLALFDGEADVLVWPNWNLEALMQELHRRNVQRLLVEGGAHTLQRFLDAGLWDEVRQETAPFLLGEGLKAPSLGALMPDEVHEVNGNVIARFRACPDLSHLLKKS